MKKYAKLAFVALYLLIPANCLAVGTYTITDIGDLGNGESRAYAINDTGQVVGRSRTWVNQLGVWHA